MEGFVNPLSMKTGSATQRVRVFSMLCKSCAGMSDPNIWWMKCDSCQSTGKELREFIKCSPTKNDLAIKRAVEIVEAQFRSKDGITKYKKRIRSVS
jgi:CRISPR/Cas system CMR-associated protein Cmr1 (group 7 of RAMP superfamily)